MIKNILIPIVTAVALASVTAHAEDKPAPEPVAKKEHRVPAEGESILLSSHSTVAEFAGIKEHRCMGRTALCPDNCGDSGSLAVFKIISYIDYQKPGKYGDPKSAKFQILIEDNKGNVKIDKKIIATIKELKAGDTVTLKWNHDYVTKNSSTFPVRTIVELTKEVSEE